MPFFSSAKTILPITLVVVFSGAQSNRKVAAQERSAARAAFWNGTDAFAGKPLLFDRPNDYQIHAVRRDKPGEVEQHTQDTELIFVLDGAATFVTGGSIADARPLGTNETTGTAIRNGESRRLGRGDVLVVPNATPHWLSEADSSVRYVAVRLRQQNAAAPAPASVMHWPG